MVATEEEVFVGGPELAPAARVQAAARQAQESGAAGLLVVISASPGGAVPRSWPEGDIHIPVLAILLGEAAGREAAGRAVPEGRKCALKRVPRETMLADCIQTLADYSDKRAGLPLLLRKVLKTCQLGAVPDLDLVALSNAIMTPHENVHALDRESKSLWACTLVDVICFICIHLAGQVIEAGQASVHAERGGGALEKRAERAAVRMRAQVMSIVDVLLASWVHKVLIQFVPRERLASVLRKLLFYEDVALYSAEPLILETHERQGVKVLQTDMCVSQQALAALVRLGSPASSPGAACAVDPTLVLELVELLVRRAVPVACKYQAAALAKPDAPPNCGVAAAAEGRDGENLVLSGDGAGLWEEIVALALNGGEQLSVLLGADHGPYRELAPRARVWQAYLVVALLAVLNPSTLGKVVWGQAPTLRAMLQMLITGAQIEPYTTHKTALSHTKRDQTDICRAQGRLHSRPLRRQRATCARARARWTWRQQRLARRTRWWGRFVGCSRREERPSPSG